MSPIVEHPDVQRMLMTMKALVQAARGICHLTAWRSTCSTHADDAEARAAAGERAALLTPVAKAFSTDIGDEVASLGVQVHGGMGYIEETGAAQYHARFAHRRDLRGHQRRPGDRPRPAQVAAVGRRDADARDRRDARGRRRGRGVAAKRNSARPRRGSARRSTRSSARRAYLGGALGADPPRRSPARRLSQAVRPRARRRLPRQGGPRRVEPSRPQRGRIGLARFFAEKLATAAPGLAHSIHSGAAPLDGCDAILAESA